MIESRTHLHKKRVLTFPSYHVLTESTWNWWHGHGGLRMPLYCTLQIASNQQALYRPLLITATINQLISSNNNSRRVRVLLIKKCYRSEFKLTVEDIFVVLFCLPPATTLQCYQLLLLVVFYKSWCDNKNSCQKLRHETAWKGVVGKDGRTSSSDNF